MTMRSVFLVAALAALIIRCAPSFAGETQAAILQGQLAKLDIKDAQIEPHGGKPSGTLTIALHTPIDPGWLDPLEHSYAITQQQFDYLIEDAMIKPMPYGDMTYALAEHAEMTADFKRAAFRLRPGLKFQDGQPLTTDDVKWTYENFKGAYAKLFHDKLDRIEIVDDRTIIFDFKEPFIDFMTLYNGGISGIGWIVPKHYYEKVGPDGFKQHPMGAGPFKFVSQEAGAQIQVEAWDGYWRRTPAAKTIVIKAVPETATRLAALQTGEVDVAYGMTGKLLPRVMADKNLRWDKNFTGPWFLLFPGYNEASSPFHDKRVREAVSLAINRTFLSKEETQGIGPPIGNWLAVDNPDTLKLPVPEYNPAKAKKLLAEAGFPNGFDFDWYIPFPPYFEMGERVMNDLRAVGIRGKLQTLDGAAFRGRIGQGRKGYPGNRSIVQNVDPRPGNAGFGVAIYAACGGRSNFICEPQIDVLWKKYEASLDVEEREDLIQKIQRILVDDDYIVPLYVNPFVQAVGPRVLPAGDGFHHYWDTNNAPYPWPWEVWAVKAD